MPVNSFDDYPMSWRPVKAELASPLYKGLAAALERDILSGALRPGTKLPPQRELADFLDINLSTVTRAFKLCELAGLLRTVRGGGTYVAFAGEGMPSEGSEAGIDLAMINPFDCPDIIRETIRSVAAKGDFLMDYGYPLGSPRQREAGRMWMGTPDEVVIVSGGQNGMAIALSSLLRPGAKVAADEFTYPSFLDLAASLGLSVIPIPADEEGMLPDALRERGPFDAVYLMPGCANPTGLTMGVSRRLAIAEAAGDALIVEDDIYSFLLPHTLPSVGALARRYVAICSTSKSLAPGLRIGYMSFSSVLRDPLVRGIYNINVKSSPFEAEVAAELILSGAADKISADKRKISAQRWAIADEYLPPVAGVPGLFRWQPTPFDCAAAEAEARRNGVRVLHAGRFAAAPGVSGDFLRVSLCAEPEPSLRRGLAILRDVLSRGRQGELIV